jgi:hypothetical protein
MSPAVGGGRHSTNFGNRQQIGRADELDTGQIESKREWNDGQVLHERCGRNGPSCGSVAVAPDGAGCPAKTGSGPNLLLWAEAQMRKLLPHHGCWTKGELPARLRGAFAHLSDARGVRSPPTRRECHVFQETRRKVALAAQRRAASPPEATRAFSRTFLTARTTLRRTVLGQRGTPLPIPRVATTPRPPLSRKGRGGTARAGRVLCSLAYILDGGLNVDRQRRRGGGS